MPPEAFLRGFHGRMGQLSFGHRSPKSTFDANNGHLEGIFYFILFLFYFNDGADEDFDHIDYDEDAAMSEHMSMFICKKRQF